jgi:imidazole glycerol-phosphate synthase subunit HisF
MMTNNMIRLIPVLFIKNGLIVRSQFFRRHQVIGNVVSQAQRLSEWNADELVYIDISREQRFDSGRDDVKVKSAGSIISIIQQISDVCLMPLAFGGGIRSTKDAVDRIRMGADKVVVNSLLFESPDIVSDMAQVLGGQAIMGSLDYRIIDGKPLIYKHFGIQATKMDLIDMALRCEDLGVGELLLQEVDRDGAACGYGLEEIDRVLHAVSIPVIACSGAGTTQHFVEVAKLNGLSGIAAGNYFNFSERSYPNIKQALRSAGVNVR